MRNAECGMRNKDKRRSLKKNTDVRGQRTENRGQRSAEGGIRNSEINEVELATVPTVVVSRFKMLTY